MATLVPSPSGELAGVAGERHIDWAAILLGVAIATGIASALFTFGTAIGLSVVSPYPGEGASGATSMVLLAVWTLVVVLLSFAAGGYITGRVRRRTYDAPPDEVEVRDGIHGLTVWGVGVVLASLLLAAGISGATGAANHHGPLAPHTSERDGMSRYTVDMLFRPAPNSTAYERRIEASSSAGLDADSAVAERLLANGMTKTGLADDDRRYLAQLVARETGLSQSDAEARVDQVLARARHLADVARKTGIVVGFFTAAALAVGAAAAAWGGAAGGHHRDKAMTGSFWRWQRRSA